MKLVGTRASGIGLSLQCPSFTENVTISDLLLMTILTALCWKQVKLAEILKK